MFFSDFSDSTRFFSKNRPFAGFDGSGKGAVGRLREFEGQGGVFLQRGDPTKLLNLGTGHMSIKLARAVIYKSSFFKYGPFLASF